MLVCREQGPLTIFLIVHLPFAMKHAMQETLFLGGGTLNYFLRIELGPTPHMYHSQAFADFFLCVWHCARITEARRIKPGLPKPQGKAGEPYEVLDKCWVD